jgi:hypothetical protein
VIEWTKRISHGIGGRISYTRSVLKDNQVGETNFYAAGGAGPLNNYNYISSLPRCTTTDFAACYNPDADFTVSAVDVPHRVIVAPVAELPFGRGHKWATSGPADWILGGWTLSAAMNFQSGFPLRPVASDNTGTFTGTQRPNLTGTDIATSGDYEDRLTSAGQTPPHTWVNPAAFAAPLPFTYGSAPRVITSVRSPGQGNVDAVFIKSFRFGGSKTAQLKIETLNLLNRVNVRALQGANTVGNSNFGQTTTQAGFMRITQIMFRFSF